MIVTFELEGPVGVLSLAAPGARNAITPQWVADLGAAADAAAASSARAVLIRADGPSFCVGADLDHFLAERERLGAELHAMVDPFHRALAMLHALEVPVVCAAQGVIAGGALGLLWPADVVLLASGARIVPAFATLGLACDGGSTWALPRIVGPRRAFELLGEGRALDAATALEWGIASAVVPDGELDAAGRERAARLAAGATQALAAVRRLLAVDGLRTHLDGELAAQTALGDTADARAGLLAFAERRAPAFEGA